MGVLPICVLHKLRVCSAYGNQKRASDLLGLKLPTVVNHFVDTGNWSPVLSKRAASAFKSEPSISSPSLVGQSACLPFIIYQSISLSDFSRRSLCVVVAVLEFALYRLVGDSRDSLASEC